MHLRARPTATRALFSNDRPGTYGLDDWHEAYVYVKGATYGQLIRVANSLGQTASAQVDGDLHEIGDRGFERKEEMGRSWQRFFDADLLQCITTIHPEYCYVLVCSRKPCHLSKTNCRLSRLASVK